MTRSTNERPTRRLMVGRYGDDFVVEVGRDVITIRPKRSRRGGPAEITVLPGRVYIAALREKIQSAKQDRRRRTRGRAASR